MRWLHDDQKTKLVSKKLAGNVDDLRNSLHLHVDYGGCDDDDGDGDDD